MIRLGTAAGHLFEGPRLLGGWTPPSGPAVYVILYRLAPSNRHAVIYVAHGEDLSKVGFRHPRAPCWSTRAGGKWQLRVAWLALPGAGHREQLTNDLIAMYEPHCNQQKYDRTWRPEWLGEYEARTTSPLTTPEDPT